MFFNKRYNDLKDKLNILERDFDEFLRCEHKITDRVINVQHGPYWKERCGNCGKVFNVFKYEHLALIARIQLMEKLSEIYQNKIDEILSTETDTAE